VKKYLTYIWDTTHTGGFHFVFANLNEDLKHEFITSVTFNI